VDFRDGAMTVSELLLHADEMCYLAKTSGRNQVKSYDSRLDQSRNQPTASDAFQRVLRPAQSARRS
jgi:hypothetical protein